MKEKTLLFVEDNEFERKLLIGAVSHKMKCRSLEATTGEECLTILATESVDLVLMDIMLPGALGSQVLLDIRKKFSAIDLPVIMITSKSNVSDVVSCLHNGANDYITKPVNFEIAVSRISTHLKLSELSSEASRLREMAAIDAMITTYNHEINNPLAIALGSLDGVDPNDLSARKRLESSLWRIADIVKKIRNLSEQKELDFQKYEGNKKKIKIL